MSDVNFGLWYDFRNPAGEISFEQLYRDSLDQMVWAESLGFGSVWLTEHHFVDDGYTPSPLVVAAAIGERTRTMRIGTNLMLLPLADPIRIAEDTASLSILTGGRFDLGVGLGYRELEFDYFKRSLKNRPSLMEEGVEIVRAAWGGESIHFKGKRYEIDGLKVSPTAAKPPRLLMGAMAPPAIDRAARVADGFLSTGGIGHDDYITACKTHGTEPAIFAGHWGIIAEDPEKEAAEVGPHALYQTNQYIKWGAFGSPDETPEFPDAPTALENGLYQVMSADEAIASLTDMLTQYPIKDVHFWAQFPGESIEHGSRRIEFIANNVLPAVRANLTSQ